MTFDNLVSLPGFQTDPAVLTAQLRHHWDAVSTYSARAGLFPLWLNQWLSIVHSMEQNPAQIGHFKNLN